MVALIRKQLAQRLGGSVAEQARLSLALWVLAHGTYALDFEGSVCATGGITAARLRSCPRYVSRPVDRRIPADSDLWFR
jgi:hypothetical protein